MHAIPVAELVRSKRRSISLEFRPDGKFIVRAPLSAKDKDIQKLLHEKRAWIAKTYERVFKSLSQVIPKQFVEGEKFLYLGAEYVLHIAEDMFGKLLFENRFILSSRHTPKARRIFERWYRDEAFMTFTLRCQHYAKLMGLQFKSLKLTSAKQRWGSCHPRGTLCFNWRLVMAPMEIIDYVVVHELAHLKQPNHSERFWAVVENTLPGYRDAKKWLKENSQRLHF